MTTPTHRYREFAEACERLAKEASTEHHRAVLREMAEAWRELSETAGRQK